MSKDLSKDPWRRPLRNVINEQGKQSIIFTLKKYGGHYGLIFFINAHCDFKHFYEKLRLRTIMTELEVYSIHVFRKQVYQNIG